MGTEFPEREVLIKYLLGELSAEERAEVAERYFADDDRFDELLEVENELLDKYERGSLGEREREAFGLYLERLPDRRYKEVVAGALTRLAGEEQARAQIILNEYATASVSPWQALLRSLPRPRRLLPYVAAAVLVAAAAALLVLFSQARRLRLENDRLRAQISDLEREKASFAQSASSPQPGAGAERERQPEEQPGPERQAEEIQAQQQAVRQPAAPAVAYWTLTPALRSAGSPDQVALPRGAKTVFIRLPVETGARAVGYRVIIQTAAGGHRRELTGLRADRGGSVSLKLPAAYFTETSYKLTLVRDDASAGELALDYYLTVKGR